ncbi:hypothetical protein Tco_0682084 [Tanacetum coccineum]|uniref:Uncharacterized protein n=1 Tax=Tanacetum coccineum TaxID=301880 RepID=A0ABQ4XRB2_9ASTR
MDTLVIVLHSREEIIPFWNLEQLVLSLELWLGKIQVLLFGVMSQGPGTARPTTSVGNHPNLDKLDNPPKVTMADNPYYGRNCPCEARHRGDASSWVFRIGLNSIHSIIPKTQLIQGSIELPDADALPPPAISSDVADSKTKGSGIDSSTEKPDPSLLPLKAF